MLMADKAKIIITIKPKSFKLLTCVKLPLSPPNTDTSKKI